MGRPWYPFYPADYGRDTGDLTLAEHGAYRLLIDHYYSVGGPLSTDVERLLRLCRATSAVEAAAVRFVLGAFFQLQEDGYHHGRIAAEIQKAADIIGKCSAAGKISAAKRQQDGNVRSTPVVTSVGTDVVTQGPTKTQPSQSQSQPQKKEQTLPAGAGRCVVQAFKDEGFDQFWKAYEPTRNAKKPDARKAWAATAALRPPLADLLKAVAGYNAWLAEETRKQKRDYPKQHPSTWLRGEVWNGYLVTDSSQMDTATAMLAWDGRAAPLVAEIGAAKFNAWFADAGFASGPPVKLTFPAAFRQKWVSQHFIDQLHRAYGEDITLEKAA